MWNRPMALAQNCPLAGIFARTGDMGTARAWHTATSLGDGTILITGNQAISAIIGAELYDPAKGRVSHRKT